MQLFNYALPFEFNLHHHVIFYKIVVELTGILFINLQPEIMNNLWYKNKARCNCVTLLSVT